MASAADERQQQNSRRLEMLLPQEQWSTHEGCEKEFPFRFMV